MLWDSVFLHYTALLNKCRTQVLCIADLYMFLIKRLSISGIGERKIENI